MGFFGRSERHGGQLDWYCGYLYKMPDDELSKVLTILKARGQQWAPQFAAWFQNALELEQGARHDPRHEKEPMWLPATWGREGFGAALAMLAIIKHTLGDSPVRHHLTMHCASAYLATPETDRG